MGLKNILNPLLTYLEKKTKNYSKYLKRNYVVVLLNDEALASVTNPKARKNIRSIAHDFVTPRNGVPISRNKRYVILNSTAEANALINLLADRYKTFSLRDTSTISPNISKDVATHRAVGLTKATSIVEEDLKVALNAISPEIRAEFRSHISTNKNLGNFKITLINTTVDKGNTFNSLKVREEAKKLIKETINNIYTKVEFSKYTSIMRKELAKTLVGKLIKRKKYKAKDIKEKVIIPPKVKRGKKVSGMSPGPALAEVSSKFADSYKIKNIIAASLHKTIKEREMATSADEASYSYLRYQTGRFARSAKVTSVEPSRTGKSLNIKFDYMKHPYSVYSPSGDRYTVGRNPERIIGRSIRHIVTQHLNKNIKIFTEVE